MAAIRGGEECERLVPLLSAVADGEAGADELALLRPHMKTCLSCRARLKEFRAAPARVAALTPVAVLVAQDAGGLRSLVESALAGAQQKAEGVLGATQQKAAVFGERAHMAAELATAQKLAAVAASAAALAGGGTAIDQLANHRGPPPPRALTARAEQHTQAKKRSVALVKQAPVRAVRELPIQAAPTPAQTFEPAGVSAPAPSGTAESGSAGSGSAGSGSAAPRPVAGSQSEFAP